MEKRTVKKVIEKIKISNKSSVKKLKKESTVINPFKVVSMKKVPKRI